MTPNKENTIKGHSLTQQDSRVQQKQTELICCGDSRSLECVFLPHLLSQTFSKLSFHLKPNSFPAPAVPRWRS